GAPRPSVSYIWAALIPPLNAEGTPMPTVLLIDDDHFRALLRLALRREGYTVREARDGDEGLRACREEPPDLVFCDLLMPDVDGLQTIEELRRLCPAVKVVAISGGGERFDRRFLPGAVALGAVAALNKPFGRAELLGAIRVALAG